MALLEENHHIKMNNLDINHQIKMNDIYNNYFY